MCGCMLERESNVLCIEMEEKGVGEIRKVQWSWLDWRECPQCTNYPKRYDALGKDHGRDAETGMYGESELR